MSDIYDGSIWKELSSPNEFLSVPYSLSLKLNVDWFKLYEHTNYSVGVIYLTIDNLPRDKRFLVENVIIVGCIPGPREPKLNINSYLKPLVDELLELYHGIQKNQYFHSPQLDVCLHLYLQIFLQHENYVDSVRTLQKKDVRNALRHLIALILGQSQITLDLTKTHGLLETYKNPSSSTAAVEQCTHRW